MTTPSQIQLDPQLLPALQERAQELAKPVSLREQRDHEAILVFRLGSDRFNLPAATTLSVRPLERYTALPTMPPWLLGLVNVRGRLLAAIDLRPLLGLPPISPRSGAQLIVLSTNNTEIALLADDVIGIQPRSARLLPQPANAPGLAFPWILGVDEKLGIACDPALLLADPRLVVNDRAAAALEG